MLYSTGDWCNVHVKLEMVSCSGVAGKFFWDKSGFGSAHSGHTERVAYVFGQQIALVHQHFSDVIVTLMLAVERIFLVQAMEDKQKLSQFSTHSLTHCCA